MPAPSSSSRRRCHSIRERPSCTIRWRWRTAAWATPRRPKRTCGSAGTLQIKPDDPLMHELDSLLHSALAYEVSGADALDRADWDAAVESFRKGIALAPNEPSLHHKLGTALALKGDTRGAVEQFEEAMRVSPTFAKAHYSLGADAGLERAVTQAVQHWQAAIKSEPGYVEARLQLAHMLQARRAVRGLARPVRLHRQGGSARTRGTIRLRRIAGSPPPVCRGARSLRRGRAGLSVRARLRSGDGPLAGRGARRPAFATAAVRSRWRRAWSTRASAASTRSRRWRWPRRRSGSSAVRPCGSSDAIAAAERTAGHVVAERITDNLKLYEAGRPCRTPWRADEPLEFQAAVPDAAPEVRRQ